jgi:HNH endonuclease/AP2 domain
VYLLGILGLFIYFRIHNMKSRDYNSVDWSEVFVEDTDSSTGLMWKISPTKNIKAGDVAGSIQTNKKSGRQYFVVGYNKTLWLVHRILWVMRTGAIDADLDIDHIDGNSLNNSVDNLRLVSNAVNMRNQKQRSTNSSGVNGVGFMTNGSGNFYAIACWQNLSGKQESKQFSCKKLGKELAFQKACEYRQKMIAELNEFGADYSERHGN